MPTLSDYEIGRKLGEGSFGDVHAAFDRNRGAHVALKRLRAPSAAAVSRFRKEFRSLADIFHPNLVTLYELFPDRGEWYIAMELVEGTDIVSYARRALFAHAETVAADAAQSLDTHPTLPTRDGAGGDGDRIRATFAQLTAGVRALHEARKLHRDLKPSNVLVTGDGIVKILDFGLVTELADASRSLADIVGTPAYMAPEQTRGQGVSEAADWYAVGAMLYETLVGVPPFEEADILSVFAAKNARDATDPRVLYADLPAALCDLSMGLLRREPSSRPPPAQIERVLDGAPSTPPRSRSIVPSARLVGRESELRALAEAFDTCRTGVAVSVHVLGASGNGKTSLVREFLSGAASLHDALIFEGRCYEGESVPFKAVDTVMSAAASLLQRADRPWLESVTPRDFDLLTRIFPVLQGLVIAPRGHASHTEIHDPVQVRRRGFAALRDMIGRISERRPIVVFVDDMQWGDLDSVALLQELVRTPDAPAFLLIVSYRAEEIATNEVLRALRERVVAERNTVLEIEPLRASDCAKLARTLLEPNGTAAEGDVDAIARESGGNPFFIHELARHVTHGARGTDDVSLDDLISERLLRLSETAQTVAQIVCLVASGVRVDLLSAMADVPGEAVLTAVSLLKNERTIRARREADRDVVEMYHDRIRERVRSLIEPSRARLLHGRIAETLAECDADPEVLVFHFRASNRPAEALPHAERAALGAASALAFDRAAKLHEIIVSLTPVDTPAWIDARVRLADALVRTGRAPEAARLYEECARQVTGDRQVDLWRRASEQHLLAGEVASGLELLDRVLKIVGLSLVGPVHALIALVLFRIWVRIRGTEPRPAKRSEDVTRSLAIADACNSAASGLVMIDNQQAALLATRFLLATLRIPNIDAARLSRAWQAESAFRAIAARTLAERKHARTYLDLAGRLAEESGSPGCVGFVFIGQGIHELGLGAFVDALASFDRSAYELRREASPAPTNIRSTAMGEVLSQVSEVFLGRYEDAWARRLRLQGDARERGDAFLEVTTAVGFSTIAELARGDSSAARRSIHRAMSIWPQRPYSQQRMFAAVGRAATELYDGKPEAALQKLAHEWSRIKLYGWHRPASYGGMLRYVRGLSHLAAATRDTKRHVRLARREARLLVARDIPWLRPFAAALRAGAYAVEGKGTAARRLLEEAIVGFDEWSLHPYAAGARLRLAATLTHDEGAMGAARRDLEALGVRDPAKFVALLAPFCGAAPTSFAPR